MQDSIKDKAPSSVDRSMTPSTNDECRPALDLDRTREQLGLGDGFIQTLLEDFNTKYATFEDTLTGHIECGDYKEARIYIHTLAGLTGTIAADEHHEQARLLEASLAASEAEIDISPIVETHNRLRRQISVITVMMNKNREIASHPNNTGNP